MAMPEFPKVYATRRRRGQCPSCGRSSERTFRDYQTVHPLNTNADGSIKTPAQVQDAVNAVADTWKPDFEHSTCRDARGPLTQQQARHVVAELGKKSPSAREVKAALWSARSRHTQPEAAAGDIR